MLTTNISSTFFPLLFHSVAIAVESRTFLALCYPFNFISSHSYIECADYIPFEEKERSSKA